MTRLFLATALVLHISGVSAVAAFVCVQPGMTVQTCCCHHERSDSQSRTPVTDAPCPCAMAPTLPVPVTETPVTVSPSQTLVSTPAIIVAVRFDPAAGARSEAVDRSAFADTSPSLLSASHLRC